MKASEEPLLKENTLLPTCSVNLDSESREIAWFNEKIRIPPESRVIPVI